MTVGRQSKRGSVLGVRDFAKARRVPGPSRLPSSRAAAVRPSMTTLNALPSSHALPSASKDPALGRPPDPLLRRRRPRRRAAAAAAAASAHLPARPTLRAPSARPPPVVVVQAVAAPVRPQGAAPAVAQAVPDDTSVLHAQARQGEDDGCSKCARGAPSPSLRFLRPRVERADSPPKRPLSPYHLVHPAAAASNHNMVLKPSAAVRDAPPHLAAAPRDPPPAAAPRVELASPRVPPPPDSAPPATLKAAGSEQAPLSPPLLSRKKSSKKMKQKRLGQSRPVALAELARQLS